MNWRHCSATFLLAALCVGAAGCAVPPAGPEIVNGKVRFVVVSTSGGG